MKANHIPLFRGVQPMLCVKLLIESTGDKDTVLDDLA